MNGLLATPRILVFILVTALLAAGLALAQPAKSPDFGEIRALIRDKKLDTAQDRLRTLLADETLPVAERATAMDLLVEAMIRAPYPDFDAAIALGRKAVAYREEKIGVDDPDLATSYRYLGMALDMSKKREEGREWFQKAVDQVERLEGPTSMALLPALNSVGVSYMGTREYPKAIELFTRMIEIYDAATDKGEADVSLYLANRGKCYRFTGDLAAAEKDYRRSIREKENQAEPDPAALADHLIDLVPILLDTNQALEAVEPAQRALDLCRQVYPEAHPKVVEAERQLGIVYRRSAQFDSARVHLERAVAIAETLRDQDVEPFAKALDSLAELEADLGNTDRAISRQERVLDLMVQKFGPDSDFASVASGRLGEYLSKAGEFARAREYFERCREIDAKTFGPDHPYVGDDILNAATVSFYAGDYDAAERGFQETETIYAAAYPEDHPQRALLNYNYGVLLGNQGRLEESRKRLKIAATSLAAALGPRSPDLAEILNDYGKILFELGEADSARAQLETALAIRRAAFGGPHPAIALSLDALANLHASLGDLETAAALADTAVAMSKETLGPDHPWTGRAMQDLAKIRVLQGDDASALDLAVQAEAVGRDHLRLLAQGSSERQTLAYAASRATGLDLATTAALRLGDAAGAERAWDQLVRSRALVLDEMGARHRAVSLATSEEGRKLVQDLRRARTRLAGLVVRGPGELDAKTHAALVAEATAEKESLEQELARADASARARRRLGESGWADVRGALGDDQALIAYQRYTPPTEPARYAAFVSGGGNSRPVLLDLGPAADIEAQVTAWHDAVLDPGVPSGPLAAQSERAYRTAAEPLRRSVWDPVAAHLGGAKLVFVVPDGALNLVNLAALPAGEGYLIESGRTLHLLSTERDLPRIRESAAPGGDGNRNLLAVGGVDFNTVGSPQLAAASTGSVFRGSRSTCGEFGDLVFKPLPQSGPEAKRVIAEWDKLKGAGSTQLLTGADATEGRFKRLAGSCGMIHAATHGFFMAGACPDPGATSAWTVEFASASNRRVPENPLLQSGLALAGANQRRDRPLDAEDGILTAEEIAALDLGKTAWVVLSACDTGLGHITAGEGVLGLRRGFEVAGAATLITSLWPVDDSAAAAWMGHLYAEHLGAGRGAAAATHAASLALLQERRAQGLSTHPHFWAPFVASGDWR